MLRRRLFLSVGLLCFSGICSATVCFGAVNADPFIAQAKKAFYETYMEGIFDKSAIDSAFLKEVEGYVLIGIGSTDSSQFLVEWVNPANDLCNIFFLEGVDGVQVKGDPFRMHGKPGSDEMLEQIKEVLTNRQYNHFAVLRPSNRPAEEDRQAIASYRKDLDKRKWSWKRIPMYRVEISLDIKEAHGGCGLAGGEVLFLENGQVIYIEDLLICVDRSYSG